MVADRLDPVAVGIPEEGRVIRRVVIAQAGRPVIAAAGGNPGIPERIDLALVSRLEAPVPARSIVGPRALADRDIDALRVSGPGPLAVAQPIRAPADLDDAKHLHDRIIE